MDIKAYLKEKCDVVDSFLSSYFIVPLFPSALGDAMTYSLLAAGKRLRPILALASYEACGKTAEEILPYAVSLEFIHTYSLIHDDLPAMDNDDLRRGRPTNHKVFGEGMAILAGDALLTEAFYLLSSSNPLFSSVYKSSHPPFAKEGITEDKGNLNPQSKPIPHSVLMKVVREVAMASGAHGMVGGQAEDLLSENAPQDPDSLSFIHTHKTGALITASVRMGGLLARAKKKDLHSLTMYGEKIGFAFQIVDDILDIEGDSKELGKQTGSDERKKKMTYPGLYGMESSAQKANDLVDDAVRALQSFSEKADPLREIARYIVRRRN